MRRAAASCLLALICACTEPAELEREVGAPAAVRRGPAASPGPSLPGQAPGAAEGPAGQAPLPANQPAEPPATQGTDLAPGLAGEWTIGLVTRGQEPPGAPVLLSARSSAHPQFDRFVLEFDGSALPSYRIEYVDRPIRQCGSGDVVPVAGEGWLSIRLYPTNAHTPEGAATVADRDRRLEHGVMRQATLTCDFEAQVEWVLGLTSPNPFRVLELSAPTRLVVDVRH